MADLMGFEASGIELDDSLVRVARELAERSGSNARFVSASFLPLIDNVIGEGLATKPPPHAGTT